MNDSSHSLESVFLSQASSLRALAWSLLGDEHAAEDVLQEVWVRTAGNASALSIREGSPDGWLRRVVSNLALNRKRAGRSRAFHEASGARSESLKATDEVAAEREVMVNVIDAVSKLGDPYQRVIVMRYYQGLAPRIIAKEHGVPVATIKSQLSRALEKLRSRLDEVSGGKRDQWAGVLSVSVASATRAKVGSLVGLVWVAAAGVLAAAAAVWVWQESPGPQAGADSRSEPVASSSPQVEGAQGSLVPSAELESSAIEDESRVALERKLPWRTAASLPANVFSLRVEVVNEVDLPAAGVGVLLAPKLHPLNKAGYTGLDGAYEATWRSSRNSMSMILGLQRSGGLQTALREIEVMAGQLKTVRIPIGHQASLHEALQDSMYVDMDERLRRGWSYIEKRLPSLAVPEPVHTTPVHESTGHSQFVWRLTRRTPQLKSTVARQAESRVVEVSVEAENRRRPCPLVEGDGTPAPNEEKRNSVEVMGQVFQESGAPASYAQIQVGRLTTTLDEDGRFYAVIEEPGDISLHAGGGVFGTASRLISGLDEDSPKRIEWTPTLDRGDSIEGRVKVDGETDTTDCLVESIHETRDYLHIDQGGFRHGSFALHNLPNGEVRLDFVFPFSWPCVNSIGQTWCPALDPIFAEVDSQSSREITLAIVDHKGEPTETRVQLWQASTGRGIWLELDETTGFYRRSGLTTGDRASVPYGEYRLVLGDIERGFANAGKIEVSVEGPSHFGPFALAEPGGIRLLVDGEVPAFNHLWSWSLSRCVAGLDSACYMSPDVIDKVMVAGPGEYSHQLRGPDFVMVPIRFTVESGRVCEVNIPRDEMGEVVIRSRRPASHEGSKSGFRILVGTNADEFHRGLLGEREAARFMLPKGDYQMEREGVRVPFTISAGERTEL